MLREFRKIRTIFEKKYARPEGDGRAEGLLFLKTAKEPGKNAGSNFILEGRKLRFLAKKPFEKVAKISPTSDWLGGRGSNPRPIGYS